VIFVEVLRLLLVVAGVITGLQAGDAAGRNTTAPVIGITLGALLAYVLGGILGRLLNESLGRSAARLRQMPASEVFAGSVVGTTGLLLGLVAGLPVIALVHSSVDYPLVAAFSWILCFLGIQLGVSKGREIVRVAGLSHLVDRPADPPSSTAFVIDTSAVLDRQLLVLGRAGLLTGGIVLARFVVDEVRTLSEGPDPVSSRRARRGLEAIEALRAAGVQVRMSDEEIPQFEDTPQKVIALARRLNVRLATCSADLAARASAEGVEAVDLRRLPGELTPAHAAGERLAIDLVREGRQARQAVGYLPDGDMVVVNDASHLVGRSHVDVVVSSARQTSQGMLVFAHLDHDGPPALATEANIA
jgi:uncharacterized protein YacL